MEPKDRSNTRSLIKVEPVDKNVIDIDDYVTKKFDYVVNSELYNHNGTCHVYELMRQIVADKQNKLARPAIVLSPDTAISSATISGNAERHVSTSSITHDIRGAMVPGMTYTSDLKVLYISSKLGLSLQDYEYKTDYAKSIVSNAMGMTSTSYTNHNVTIDPKNIIFLGIRDDLIDESEQEALDSMGENKPYIFTYQNVMDKGIERIMKFVQSSLSSHKVHVVFDLSAVSIKIAPSVIRYVAQSDESDENSQSSLPETREEIERVFRGLDQNDAATIMRTIATFKESGDLVGFDLTGYNMSTKDRREQVHASNMLTSKIIINILHSVSDFAPKSVNVFDQNSKFLIWKKIPELELFEEKEGDHNEADAIWSTDPIGWHILRNIDLDTRSQLIAHFERLKQMTRTTDTTDDAETVENPVVTHSNNPKTSEPKSSSNDREYDQDMQLKRRLKAMSYPISNFQFENDDGSPLNVIISVTTPAEQEMKSYYIAESYTDRCLLPGEKVNMTFELLATPKAIEVLNQEAERANADGTALIDSGIETDSDTENDETIETDGIGMSQADLLECEELYNDFERQNKNNDNNDAKKQVSFDV